MAHDEMVTVWDPRSRIDTQMEYFTDIALKETQRWIEAVTRKSFKHSSARRSLENGILLCELLNCIRPQAVKRINRLPTPLAGVDNLNVFLKACEKFGLKDSQLFDPGDLQDLSHRIAKASELKNIHERRLRNVVITIYWLGKSVRGQFNGPKLDLDAFTGLVKNCTSNVNDITPIEHYKEESFGSSYASEAYVSYNTEDIVKPSYSDYQYQEPSSNSGFVTPGASTPSASGGTVTTHHYRDSSYESFGSYDRHNSDDGTDIMPVGYDARRHSSGNALNNDDMMANRQYYSATLDTYYNQDDHVGNYRSNPDLSRTYAFGVYEHDQQRIVSHNRYASSDGLDHHSRHSSDSNDSLPYDRRGLKKTSTSQPAHNPLQFIKTATPPLAHKAEQQLKQAAVNKTNKPVVVEHEQEDWKSNFSSWKNKRRKSSHFERLKDITPLEESNAEETRKPRTYKEMMDSREKRSKSFSHFPYDDEEESNDAIAVEHISPVDNRVVESSPKDSNANSMKPHYDYSPIRSPPRVAPKPMPRNAHNKSHESENPFKSVNDEGHSNNDRSVARGSQSAVDRPERVNGNNNDDESDESEGSSSEDEDVKRMNQLNISNNFNNTAKDNKDFLDMSILIEQPVKDRGFGFSMKGGRDQSKPVTVDQVTIDSPAYNKDLLEGDEIVLVNGEPVGGLFLGSVKLTVNQACKNKGHVNLKIRRYHETAKTAIRNKPENQPPKTSRFVSPVTTKTNTSPPPSMMTVLPSARDHFSPSRPERRIKDLSVVDASTSGVVEEPIVPVMKKKEESVAGWFKKDSLTLMVDLNGRGTPLSVDTVDSEEERHIMAELDQEEIQEEEAESIHRSILEDEATDKGESSSESHDTVIRRDNSGRNIKKQNLQRRSDFFGFEHDVDQFDTPHKGANLEKEESLWTQKVEAAPSTFLLQHNNESEQRAMWQRVEGESQVQAAPGTVLSLKFQAQTKTPEKPEENEIEKQEREIIENLEREEKAQRAQTLPPGLSSTTAQRAQTLPPGLSSTTAFEQFHNERNSSAGVVRRTKDLESGMPQRQSRATSLNRRSFFSVDEERKRMEEWTKEQEKLRQEQYEREQEQLRKQYEVDQQRATAQKQEKSPVSSPPRYDQRAAQAFSPNTASWKPVNKDFSKFQNNNTAVEKEKEFEKERIREEDKQRWLEEKRKQEDYERTQKLKEKEEHLRKEEERLKLEQERVRVETEKLRHEKEKAELERLRSTDNDAPQAPLQTFYQPVQNAKPRSFHQTKDTAVADTPVFSTSIKLNTGKKSNNQEGLLNKSAVEVEISDAIKPKTFSEQLNQPRQTLSQAREEVLKMNRKPNANRYEEDMSEVNKSDVKKPNRLPIQKNPIEAKKLQKINAVPKPRKLATWIVPESERDKRPSRRPVSTEIPKPQQSNPQEHWVVQEAERRRVAEQNERQKLQNQQPFSTTTYNVPSQNKNSAQNFEKPSELGVNVSNVKHFTNADAAPNVKRPLNNTYENKKEDVIRDNNSPSRQPIQDLKQTQVTRGSTLPLKSEPSPPLNSQQASPQSQASLSGSQPTYQQPAKHRPNTSEYSHPGVSPQQKSQYNQHESLAPRYTNSQFISPSVQPRFKHSSPQVSPQSSMGFQPIASKRDQQQFSPPKPPRAPSSGSSNDSNAGDSMMSVSGKQRCSHCNDELGRGAAMVIESLNLYYHVQCFRCCVCHAALGNGQKGADVRVRVSKLHCRNCYSNDEVGLKYSAV